MAAPPQVAVVGLKPLLRDLKKMGENTGPLNKAMSAAGRHAAGPVADAARQAVPHVTGTLAGTIRASGTRTGASVRMGGIRNVAYAGPVEFGGWPAGREYIATGRYLFPAARQLADHAAADYSAGVQAAFDHFNWTNTTTNPEAVHD